jgi:hypothetical protein
MKMSAFKKMYLVNSDKINHKQEITVNPYQHVISPYLQSISNLDEQMKDILNSDMNDDEKAKLYTNVLKKYLIHRHKFMEPYFETKNYVDLEPAERVPIKILKPKKKKLKVKKKMKKVKISKESKMPIITDTVSNIEIVPSTSASLTKTDFTSPTLKRRRLANLQAKKRIRRIVENESTRWENF